MNSACAAGRTAIEMYEMIKLVFGQEAMSRSQTLYSFYNCKNVVIVNVVGYPFTRKVDENEWIWELVHEDR